MDEPQLWVRSERTPFGGYGVTITVGDDTAWRLDRDRAIAYAVACIARATEVEHDTAVFTLLVDRLGLDVDVATRTIAGDIARRRDHARVNDATAPLRFDPAIGRRRSTGKPVALLMMHLDGTRCGQLTSADLRSHADGVLRALAAAELDDHLHQVLTTSIGLDAERARAVIEDLQTHWPADEPVRSSS